MEKEILEALIAKFEGVSETILSRIADKLAKTITTTEEVTTAVKGVTLQQLLDSYGDSRATEAQRTSIRNYEKKHRLRDGLPIGSVNPEPEQNVGDAPEWAKALINANKTITERLEKVEMERTMNNRHQQLSALINKLPEPIRQAYKHTAVSNLSDDEFNSLVQEVQTEVSAIVNELQAKGAVFNRPSAGKQSDGKSAVAAEVDAVVGKLNI